MLRCLMAVVSVAILVPRTSEAVYPIAPSVQQLPDLAPQPSAVAFVNVSIVPMDTERVLTGQTVLVRDGRIATIGPTEQVTVPRTALRIDGRGHFLMPGLADMHVHIFTGIRQTPMIMPAVLAGFLAKGITTVRDMHSGSVDGSKPDSFALRAKEQLAAGRILGPRLYTAGDLISRRDLSTLRNDVAMLRARGHDFVKIDDSPSAWERAAYDTVHMAANSLGLRIAGHVPQVLNDPAVERLQRVFDARWASIEHLMGYVNYLIGFDGGYEAIGSKDTTAAWLQPTYRLDQVKVSELALATRRAGIWNCPTLSILDPSLNNKFRGAFWPQRNWRQYFDFDLQIVKALHDAGAGLLLGTDMATDEGKLGGAMSVLNGKYSLQRELALLVRAGLTPYQALVTGTRSVASFMRMEDSAGTVAVGKWADLVLLTRNPLEDVHHTAAPVGVMSRGRWLPRTDLERRLQQWEEERARVEKAQRREWQARQRARTPDSLTSTTP